MYPCCAGHEIVGTAVRVGNKVRDEIKHPDKETESVWARNPAVVFGRTARNALLDSSTIVRMQPIRTIAPTGMVTTLTVANGAGPGKRVGVIGIGGLGHFGVLFAKAMKCDRVVAISRGENKRDDALKMGADLYIATADEPDWAATHANSLDLIICTVSSARMPLNDYLGLLCTKGRFVQVGLPEGPLPPLNAGDLVLKGSSIGFSNIASPGEIKQMLDLAAKAELQPWIQLRPMSDVNQVIQDMGQEKARYRYVLVNE
ncbi:MAG: hypothetical protein M1825_005787 [Sarcosagium campestre]|nr:MAG: hypothetical protein M1825_005787 [Sarcosagium campestre]